MLYLRQLSKTWVFGLGALLAFQVWGWYLSFGILMLDAKMAARQMLAQPSAPCQQVTIAAADLARMWVGDREIRLAGALCDVGRQLSQGDSVRLEIYHDIQEETLLVKLYALLSTEEDAAKSHHLWLCQLLVSAYLLPVLPMLPAWRLKYFL
ncbi:MAG: hypothetical protein ABIQ93_03535, partial [Saprospiraceae bacterium]